MSQPGSSVGAGHPRKEPSRLGRRIGIFVGGKGGKTSKLIEDSVELNIKDGFPNVVCFFVIPYWNSIHSKTALDLLNQLLGLHRFTMTVLQIIEDPIMFHILGKPPF
jgi:hypothetical protein